jgi:general secretion pathway protein C
MLTDASRLWSTRIVTFTISALAAASVVYWGLKGWGPHVPSTAPAVVMAQASAVNPQAIARALGGGLAPVAAAPGASPAASRYALVGVAARRLNTGAALISVDGQDAKPVRVGSLVDEGMMLESVAGRRAVLSSTTDASLKLTLEMPLLEQ